VTRTPLQGLTDAQLHTPRRLLAAALADGEAPQLIALAEADAS
jgi:hypothetical protein